MTSTITMWIIAAGSAIDSHFNLIRPMEWFVYSCW